MYARVNQHAAVLFSRDELRTLQGELLDPKPLRADASAADMQRDEVLHRITSRIERTLFDMGA